MARWYVKDQGADWKQVISNMSSWSKVWGRYVYGPRAPLGSFLWPSAAVCSRLRLPVRDPDAAWKAWDDWINGPVKIHACRSDWVWPPQ